MNVGDGGVMLFGFFLLTPIHNPRSGAAAKPLQNLRMAA